MRKLRMAAGAALVLTAVSLALVPATATATTLTQTGWWWRVNDALAPAAVPAPTVPEGGLMVAGAPDGATAIAALHFEVDDGEGSPVLTLAVAENGDQGGDVAVLAACLTGSAWQPEAGGPWVNKPFAACEEGAVNGVRAADGTSWSFALAPLLSDGIVDVTIVPGTVPDLPPGLNGSTFSLVFAPPTAASLTTTAGAGAPPPIDLPALGAPVGGTDGGFTAPALGDGDLTLPAVGTVPGFTPALPEADQGLTATAPVVQERNAPLAAAPVAVVEDHKVLASVILLLCGAALLWSAQLPTPDLRRLGGFDGPAAVAEPSLPPAAPPDGTAGLGRFARPRSGPSPRL